MRPPRLPPARQRRDVREGVNYATLPAGAMAINKDGTTYYLSGNTWFQPAYGANGVYYRVVAAP